jgi:hypothetical protein
VNASPARVFEMFSTADGLNRWWTKEASGEPKLNAEFRLYFGPGYDWRARVTRYVPGSEFELQMTRRMWIGQSLAWAAGLRRRVREKRACFSIAMGGPRRMNTGGYRATAGRCICGSCGATSSTASPYRTKNVWMYSRRSSNRNWRQTKGSAIIECYHLVWRRG